MPIIRMRAPMSEAIPPTTRNALAPDVGSSVGVTAPKMLVAVCAAAVVMRAYQAKKAVAAPAANSPRPIPIE
jgi:hypothetical protein